MCMVRLQKAPLEGAYNLEMGTAFFPSTQREERGVEACVNRKQTSLFQ